MIIESLSGQWLQPSNIRKYCIILIQFTPQTQKSQINNLIAACLTISKNTRLPTDETYAQSDGNLIPIPKGSPIELLPNLLKALLLYKAPLKFLTTIIVDILQDILREYLKRKLTQRDATNFYFISFNVSKILKIPIGASHLIIQLNNFPLYISKRFDQDIDKSLVKGLGQSNPNLSKYIRDGLCTLSFGIALSDQLLTQSVFWDKDRHIEYVNQIIEIPKYDYVNINKYAYIYLNESMDVTVSYLK